MSHNRVLVVALLLFGALMATGEETFLHAGHGCTLDAGCSACLLRLTTTGVVPAVYTPPATSLTPELPAVAPAPRHRPPDPRRPSSRGPPAA